MNFKNLIKFAAFLLIVLTAALTTSCCKEEDNAMKMTMTTAKEGLMDIGLAGKGTAVINWGDGTPDETVTFTDLITWHSHTYSNSTTRTITIIGDNVTMLCCSDNQLITLDVSKNPAIEELYCSDNQLTALDMSKNPALTRLDCNSNQITALDVSKNPALKTLAVMHNLFEAEKEGKGLNPLFRTLPNNVIDGGRVVVITNNPGTDTCDTSIATSKGWAVNFWSFE